ncbi:MAG TPA: ring-cleaving dioxygenase [Thermoanaerobaculia bacterium]|jgi:glyoxalase family protein|nr:ring-cleaving dioxygenase [Thermoanaerobaculia bacterium]
MRKPIAGIHHVTAMASDPQANVEFYTGVLGLRLVKKTVNFDDPGTYHLYYGDEVGHPGTIMTFFPWPMARRGVQGAGQATVTSFAVPEGSLGFWTERLARLGVTFDGVKTRFDEEVLTLLDPDGLRLELVARADGRPGWMDGPVPAEHAVRGFDGVTLTEWNLDVTQQVLAGTLGFRRVREEGDRVRFEAGTGEGGGAGSRVDVLASPSAARGRVSAGTVHHVAFRAADEADQLAWRRAVDESGLYVTPVLDRQYFRSIYFREPGGVLFEIATDPPGFTWDEPVESLGSGLKLPPWLEESRPRIEAALPPVETHTVAVGGAV